MTPSPEEAAHLARQRLGIGSTSPVPDLLRLVEDEDRLRVFMLPLGSKESSTGIQPIDGAIKISDDQPFVLLNISNHPVRIRFTLAHEYGHYVLDHGSQVDVRIDLNERRPIESSANSFAAQLLMPRRGVSEWLDRHQTGQINLETVTRLACYFNVSVPAAHFRLVNMGRLRQRSKIANQIKDKQHYGLASQLGLVGAQDSLVAAHRQGAYVPAEMQTRIARLLERGILSDQAAAARLRVPEMRQGVGLKEALSAVSDLSSTGEE